jgi:hypothetical protein
MGERDPLRLCEDHLANAVRIPTSRPAAERWKQPHDHTTMPINRRLCDTAMLPQPVLELDYTPTKHSWRACRLEPDNTAFAQELHEPANSPYVLLRYALRSATAGASAAMPCKQTDDGIINVGNRDLGQSQPLRDVTGCRVIAPHRQGRVPQIRKVARELRQKVGEIASIHAPLLSAARLI